MDARGVLGLLAPRLFGPPTFAGDLCPELDQLTATQPVGHGFSGPIDVIGHRGICAFAEEEAEEGAGAKGEAPVVEEDELVDEGGQKVGEKCDQV